MFIDNINSLFSIINTVSALRNSLRAYGLELDVMNAILIHIVLSKKVYDEKLDFSSLFMG